MKGQTATPTPSGGSVSSHSVSINKAENGFIVRVSHDDGKKYESKQHVARTEGEAHRLMGKALKGKLMAKRDGGKR